MSISTIAMVASYAMAAYSTVVAIKAIANGDYVTALIAGVGAVAGFSAGAALNAGAAGAGGAGATVGGVAELSSMGAAASLPSSAIAPATASAVGGAMTPASLATMGAPAISGAMSAVPSIAPAIAPATGGSLLGNISKSLGETFQGGVGDVVNNIKQLGTDLFQNIDTGEMFNKSGTLLGKLDTTGSMLGGIAQIAAPVLSYQSQQDQMDASKKTEEKEEVATARDWSNRNYIPKFNVPTMS